MGIYLLKTVYGYVKTMSHDEAPREKEAEEGSTVYMKFRKFVKDVFKKDLTTLFTGKRRHVLRVRWPRAAPLRPHAGI